MQNIITLLDKKLFRFLIAIFALIAMQIVCGMIAEQTQFMADSSVQYAGLGAILSLPKGRASEAPGFKFKVMIFLHKLCSAFPVPMMEFPGNPEDHDNSVSGGFTLETAEDTAIVIWADDAPSIESTSQGEDYGSFKNSGKFYVKGDNSVLAQLASTLNNEDCSVVIEKLSDGTQQLYGTTNNPVRFKPKRSSDGKLTGKNGYELPFEVDCVYPSFDFDKAIGEDGKATV